MTPSRCRGTLLVALSLMAPRSLEAQGYRLRLESRAQSVAYRGITRDSVLHSATVIGPNGGRQTSDGFAVRCNPNSPYCVFYRPGPARKGGPLVTSADLVFWGFGVAGLSLHANARLGFDLGDTDAWPGTDPALQLVEGYLEYERERISGRIGRQTTTSRFGFTGYDGARLGLRDQRTGLELVGYGGWGLARASALPLTSSVLNPLDEFQPRRRQWVVGGDLRWSWRYANVRLEYQRQVDRRSNYFISERVAFSAEVRPVAPWSVTGGAEYDLAQGWWGSADGSLRYHLGVVDAAVGVRRYRPHFDLWTIWGAFSPVAYRAYQGTLAVSPVSRLRLRAWGERYRFEASNAEAPLVATEDDGWRASFGATCFPSERWILEAGYRLDHGPGAASRGWEGSVTVRFGEKLSLAARGATLSRPLEFRFDESDVTWLDLEATAHPTDRLRLDLTAARSRENRHRPDAAAFDWDQLRLAARVTFLFSSGADLARLPPAVRRRPAGGERH